MAHESRGDTRERGWSWLACFATKSYWSRWDLIKGAPLSRVRDRGSGPSLAPRKINHVDPWIREGKRRGVKTKKREREGEDRFARNAGRDTFPGRLETVFWGKGPGLICALDECRELKLARPAWTPTTAVERKTGGSSSCVGGPAPRGWGCCCPTRLTRNVPRPRDVARARTFSRISTRSRRPRLWPRSESATSSSRGTGSGPSSSAGTGNVWRSRLGCCRGPSSLPVSVFSFVFFNENFVSKIYIIKCNSFR